MPIYIDDPHLERSIERIRLERGDKTLTKCAKDLLRERITEVETEHRILARQAAKPAHASV